MLTTMGALRRLLREYGVDDTMRTQAGWFNPMGVSASFRDREALLHPPPALGDEEACGEEDDEQEEERPAVAGRDKGAG
jgi:hypothetical protein